MSEQKKLRVGVVFGGRSAEHEVSLVSARAVLAALDPTKYEVTLIGVTREGRWLPFGTLADADPVALMQADSRAALNSYAATLADPSVRGLAQISDSTTGGLQLEFGEPLDVIFPVLHGPYGEDGTLQGLLELANLPYVGCGVLASSVGMDKVMARDLFRQYNLPTLPYFLLKRRDWHNADSELREALIAQIEENIGYPCFVKPVNMGSSVGISKVRNREQLSVGIAEASRYDRKLMIEKGLENPRELEVAVLGNDDPEASVVGEIHMSKKANFYDYQTKYHDDEIGFSVPALLDEEVGQHIRSMAILAFLALDCAGMTRIDFFQDRVTGLVYLNEVNTIPGFTPVSMYPMMWEKSGLSYSALLDRLIELALERHADKNRNELNVK